MNLIVALLISGELRSFLENGSWTTIAENVVRILSSEARVHTFICPESTQAAQRLQAAATWTLIQSELQVRQVTVGKMPASLDVFHYAVERAAQCYLEAKRAREVQFTHFLRARPDQVWHGPMPALSTLTPGAISLRAWALHGGARGMRVPLNALSPNRSGFGDVAGPRHHTVCRMPSSCDAVPDDCLAADDQFAVCPAELAPAYFLSRRRGAVAANTRSISCARLARRDDLPVRTTAWSLSDACRECLGVRNGSSGEWMTGVPEVRLALRLLELQCPLDVVPFQFHLAPKYSMRKAPGTSTPFRQARPEEQVLC